MRKIINLSCVKPVILLETFHVSNVSFHLYYYLQLIQLIDLFSRCLLDMYIKKWRLASRGVDCTLLCTDEGLSFSKMRLPRLPNFFSKTPTSSFMLSSSSCSFHAVHVQTRDSLGACYGCRVCPNAAELTSGITKSMVIRPFISWFIQESSRPSSSTTSSITYLDVRVASVNSVRARAVM